MDHDPDNLYDAVNKYFAYWDRNIFDASLITRDKGRWDFFDEHLAHEHGIDLRVNIESITITPVNPEKAVLFKMVWG